MLTQQEECAARGLGIDPLAKLFDDYDLVLSIVLIRHNKHRYQN